MSPVLLRRRRWTTASAATIRSAAAAGMSRDMPVPASDGLPVVLVGVDGVDGLDGVEVVVAGVKSADSDMSPTVTEPPRTLTRPLTTLAPGTLEVRVDRAVGSLR